jgi:hypothetical protein
MSGDITQQQDWKFEPTLCVCGTCGRKRLIDVQRLADRSGFTYQEAFDYILTIGIAHTRPTDDDESPFG